MKRHTASKLFRVLCGMVVMLALVAGITTIPVLAASNGIYIATATPHYKHPITGKIEDAGGDGSSVLGQSMTESATYKKALVEVDPQGNTYITVRLQLMDNIQNPQFQVDGNAVSASLMQEDYTNNTADYRMMVNSENSIIRCSMYVIAMGRDVVFYITVSNLQSGSGDFITSVKVEQPKQPEPVEPSKPIEPQNPVDSQPPVQQPPATNPPATEPPVPDSTAPFDSETSNSDFEETEAPEDDEDEILGLQEFDKNGNKVDRNSDDTKDDAPKKSSGSAVVGWILGGVALIAAAGRSVWYFCFFKRKN